MSEVQSKLSPYKNKNLFSRHYLTDRLERTSIWDVDDEELENAYDELKRIYDEQKEFLPHTTNNEVEVRNEFINPILRQVLNFKKQQEAKSGNSQKVPDYALYDTSEKKAKALETEDYYENAIGILEAKAWKKDLEKKTATGDPSTDDSNPTKQIVSYLIENKPQWGILTNGKKWRLVNRDASDRLDTYYEVDIENLLTSDGTKKERLEEFKYFYIFFRKQAFQGNEGDKLLDELLDESLRYAEDIGEDLEENIYEALEWISRGFIEIKKNKERGIEEEPIEKIHEHSLILLYRILFVLYADSRGILGNPGEQQYDNYSINSLIDEVTTKLDKNDGDAQEAFSHGTLKWLQLNSQIFPMIDEGSQSQGIPKDDFYIPAYNGGLFSQEKYPFFDKYTLRDSYLAKVLDLVARTERGEEKGKARVDYYDLSVRHLGGIYEGLLEYQLEKAEEDMVEVKEDGAKVVRTVEEAEEDADKILREIDEGQPYLVTDDGERKATGSYYTPDYIVKYIVENTVGPKVEEEIEGLETDEEKAEAILDMQILDPAMGSAHFLVEVIDYLATELVDHKEIEIEQAKREVARQCVYGVDVNPLATELGKLSIWLKTISEDKPLSFLDHHIKTGNSLIGADIHGINRHPEEDEDSERQVTIGEEFGEENAGVVRANVQEMLKKFKEIQEKQADSPEDIKEQEELYQEFLDFPFRKRFDVLADVYTSHYFDNNYKVDDYNRLLQAFKLQEQKEEGDEEWNKVIKEDWVQKATDSLNNSHKEDNTSNEKGFFHWKLEFPEVFFDIEEGTEKQDSGFDAVVGNPPYFNMGDNCSDSEKNFFANNYDVYEGGGDICYNFYERSISNLEKDGRLGFITSRYFQEGDTGENLRNYLSKFELKQIVDFGSDVKVFKDSSGKEITIHTLITVLENRESRGKASVMKFKDWPVEEDNIRGLMREVKTHLGAEVKINSNFRTFKAANSDITSEKWNLEPLKYSDIVNQIQNTASGKLGTEYADVVKAVESGMDRKKVNGEKEGVFRLTESEIEEKGIERELIYPLVKTAQVDRYSLKPQGEYMLYVTPETNLDKYPNAKRHLESYREDLASRHDIEKNDEMPWYSWSNLRNWDLYEKEEDKIVWPMVSPKNKFAPVPKNTDVKWSADVYYLVPKARTESIFSLLGLMNSSLLEFYHRRTAKQRNWGYSYGSSYVKEYPIIEENQKVRKKSKNIADKKSKFYSETESFKEWVEGEWGVEINNLSTLKTKMNEYWEYDFDEFMRIAKKNKSQIDGNVKSREFRELMKDEWENSMLTLEPLMNKIDELENEIDAIVFDLYDLTEEEVETVLDSLDTPEGEKASILEKFEEVSSRSPISSPQV
jgi:hypothetical protein